MAGSQKRATEFRFEKSSMNKDLINAYVHGNLQEALLIRLYVEMFRDRERGHKADDEDKSPLSRDQSLQAAHASVRRYLETADRMLLEDPDIEQIRQTTYLQADKFFAIVKDMLEPHES